MQQASCPLFRLPAELRNHIYELALTRDHLSQIYHIGGDPKNLYSAGRQPALTHTCRAIRTEVLPIFYSGNSFVVGIKILEHAKHAFNWLMAMGRTNRERLRQVYVWHFTWDCYVEQVQRPGADWLKNVTDAEKVFMKGKRFYVVKVDSLIFDD